MGKHISSVGKLKAKLKRSRDYREKGYRHIKGNGGRKSAYGDLDLIQKALQARGTGVRGKGVTKGSKAHARRYTFTSGRNFQIGKSPYHNQAHHLLPEEAVSTNYLSPDQVRMLQGVDYNINNGENIIFLPALPDDTVFHDLPYHSGPHADYTRKVARDMRSVRNSLDKALAKDKKHKEWNPPDDIKDKLMSLQEKYWDLVVDAGGIAINKFVKPRAKKKGITKSKK